MNYAFEITSTDVMIVGWKLGRYISDEKADEIMDVLDFDLIESAALKAGCGMSEQIDSAYEELARQLQTPELEYLLN